MNPVDLLATHLFVRIIMELQHLFMAGDHGRQEYAAIKASGKVKGPGNDIFQKLWDFLTALGHSQVRLSKLCWQSAAVTQASIYKALFTLMMLC